MVHRVFIAAALLAFVLLLAPHGTLAADPQAALARHAAFVGHPDGTVVTYRHRPGAASPAPKSSSSPGDAAPSPDSDAYTTYRRGALYREIGSDPTGGTHEGFNGRAYWRANENGYVVLVLDDAARRAVTENAVETGAFGASAEVQDRGTQTVDGKQADVVRVTPRGGVAADIALDPATGAYVEVTFDPAGRRTVLHVEGYKEIAPGVRVPSAIRYGRDTGYTLERGEARAVTDAELNPPTPSSTWAFGSDDVPIEVARQGEGRSVIVRASINGRPGTFLLDSGASSILLYRPYADRLGLTMLGTTSYSGVNGGVRTARYARANTIAVGDSTLSNVILTVSGKDAAFHNPIDGILGFDLLAGAVVHVDLAQQRIAFADPAKVQPVVGKGAYAFPVSLLDFTPEVPVNVGSVPTRATFDTGDDFFAVLSDNLKTSGRLIALPEELTMGIASTNLTIAFSGVDGQANEPASCHRLRELSVGPYRYQNATTCFGSERVFGRDGGLIGFDFLRHFNWTFDYTRSHLVLTPNGL